MELRSANPSHLPPDSGRILLACRSAFAAALIGAIAVAAAVVFAPATAETAPIPTYTWTGNGLGGVWQNGSLGQFNATYVNSPTAQAAFTGTAETVSVSGTVEAASLNFLTGGYTLASGTVSLGSLGQITTAAGITTIDSALAGGGSWSVGGAGTLHLGADSRSTLTAAVTLADSANLNLGSSGAVGGDVALGAGTTISGSGAVGGTVSGAGTVSPGSSPGILTATAIAPAGGLSLTFEFDDFGPIYNFPAASQNDVLRLTSPSAPFATGLTSANVVSMFLTENTIIANNAYEGGLYTDVAADFTSSIAAADFRYYVLGDGNGTDATLGGQGYYSFANWKAATGANPALSFVVSTIPRTVEFVIGTPVSGRSMLVTAAVPEPPTFAMALSALGLAAVFTARRRGRTARRLRFGAVATAALVALVALAAWSADSAMAADGAPAAAPERVMPRHPLPASGILALASDRDFATPGAAPTSAIGVWTSKPLPLAAGMTPPAELERTPGAGMPTGNGIAAVLAAHDHSLTFEFDDSRRGYTVPPLREADIMELTHLAACFATHQRIDRQTVRTAQLVSTLLPQGSAEAKPAAAKPRDLSAVGIGTATTF